MNNRSITVLTSRAPGEPKVLATGAPVGARCGRLVFVVLLPDPLGSLRLFALENRRRDAALTIAL